MKWPRLRRKPRRLPGNGHVVAERRKQAIDDLREVVERGPQVDKLAREVRRALGAR